MTTEASSAPRHTEGKQDSNEGDLASDAKVSTDVTTSADAQKKQTKRGIPSTITSATAARAQHVAGAATIEKGIQLLDDLISRLKVDHAKGTLSPEFLPSIEPDMTSADVLDAMIAVIDERSKPSIEFVLGVLGANDVPEPLLERQRSQGARALVGCVRNRIIARRREAAKAAKRASAASAAAAAAAAAAAKEKAEKERVRKEAEAKEAAEKAAAEKAAEDKRAAEEREKERSRQREIDAGNGSEASKNAADSSDRRRKARPSSEGGRDQHKARQEQDTGKAIMTRKRAGKQTDQSQPDSQQRPERKPGKSGKATPASSRASSVEKASIGDGVEDRPTRSARKSKSNDAVKSTGEEGETAGPWATRRTKSSEREPRSGSEGDTQAKEAAVPTEKGTSADRSASEMNSASVAGSNKDVAEAKTGKGADVERKKEEPQVASIIEALKTSEKTGTQAATVKVEIPEEGVVPEKRESVENAEEAEAGSSKGRRDDAHKKKEKPRDDENKKGKDEGRAVSAGPASSGTGRPVRERRASSRRSFGLYEELASEPIVHRTRLRRESSNLHDGAALLRERDPFMAWCYDAWNKINSDKISIPFRKPVTARDAPGYFDVVKRPMDLSTVQANIQDGTLSTPPDFYRDMILICRNAMQFNGRESDLYELAVDLKQMIKQEVEPILQRWRETQDTAGDAHTDAGADSHRKSPASPTLRSFSRYPSRRSSWRNSGEEGPPSPGARKKRVARGRKRPSGADRDDADDSDEEKPSAKRAGGGRGRRSSKGHDRPTTKERERDRDRDKEKDNAGGSSGHGRASKRGSRALGDDEREETGKRRRLAGRRRRGEDD